MCIGIPGQIVALDQHQPQHAWADVCGVQREVNIALVCREGEPKEAMLGCWVLIHVGFAMSRLDQQEAEDMLAALQAMGEVEQDVALFLAGEDNHGLRR
ncbi:MULTISPECIES: HypC/HybG/HupF family hydrogenase formation chaperone [Serratia]|jgi:hydrogenase expression/formation protein HypC|uniref:HypC/HybG/HupF family hydrogenase formation chaperone n=1 Tax=Serratia liquefaciens TaxID=614 RepID=A0A379Z5I1_SERLI|nr:MULTISPECIES: HypC/HybG/HupF family hydrogenase formation chaperone [Serratia]AGQ31176.1 hydrogenase assembly chaperone [Serratia liquefaciens ATCC 27592]AKE10452.1 hydrogenase assembly chaperone [Serratia liquefaciens]AYO38112.1 HypC/HybG/HupF family hydrogenase formation chaperone [Serratia sp. P2ACOL2]MBH2810583.1 HypC/HybG/HupF family hydrogenase formation chaperone [Serratia liquefaciens]MBI6160423.1 HypC/HybG/HupF family hydrogenase formation chaperone [Serratia liquefaciens]